MGAEIRKEKESVHSRGQWGASHKLRHPIGTEVSGAEHADGKGTGKVYFILGHMHVWEERGRVGKENIK